MYKIAVIKLNQFHVPKENYGTITREYLREEIPKYIEYFETDDLDEIKYQIVINLGMNEGTCGTTEDSFDTPDAHYQIIHVPFNPFEYNLDEETMMTIVNGVSSYLNKNNNTIYGNGILIKSNMTPDGPRIGQCTEDDIIDIIYKKFNHTGLIVRHDGTFEEFTFNTDPSDHLDQESVYTMIQKNYYGFELRIFIKSENFNNQENTFMTPIFNKFRVYDDVYIINMHHDKIFGDITTQDILKIYELCEYYEKVEYTPEKNHTKYMMMDDLKKALPKKKLNINTELLPFVNYYQEEEESKIEEVSECGISDDNISEEKVLVEENLKSILDNISLEEETHES